MFRPFEVAKLIWVIKLFMPLLGSPGVFTKLIKSAAFLNNTLLLGGNSGIILSSTNGTTWTDRNSDQMGVVRALTFGNSTYVAGGQKDAKSSNMITSTNLITWTTRDPQFGSFNITGLAFGNGVFVAGGAAGMLRTSTDAITWTTRTAYAANGINAMIFDGSVFISAGDAGKMASSTDGITWTLRNPSFGTSTIATLLDANNLYIAAGDSTRISTFAGSTISNTEQEAFINWNLSPTVALD
jgi:hypothetical protein